LDTNAEGDRAFEKYCDNMRALKEQNGYKEQTGYSLGSSYKAEGRSIDADINFSVKSRLMDLRKTCNHPYLIEYPLSEDGNFYQADEDMIDICGKLKVLDQMLAELRERGHKVLIFSQMTKLLDILSDYLHYRDINFSRLDGSMHFEDRQDNIDRFNNIPEQGVFLLSTRAGGLGINLTAADTVIIYDSDWNPQQDLQAQDRAHRIGQTKPVMVYRLVTANTIDEKIVERAAAKRKLEKMIIHKNKFKSQDTDGLKTTMQALTPQELMELLESKDHAGVVDRKDQPVFTKEEMDLLLDRSDLTWAKINKEQKPNNTKKQSEDFGLTSLAVDDKSNENGAIKSSANHFKVIDTDGLPQGLPSVQED
jgi:ATP-dependent DNA helicase